jgi:hypothetical protein
MPFIADDYQALLQLADRIEALGYVAEDPQFDTAGAAAMVRAIIGRLPGGKDEPIMLATPEEGEFEVPTIGEEPGLMRWGPDHECRALVHWSHRDSLHAKLVQQVDTGDFDSRRRHQIIIELGGRRMQFPMPRSFSRTIRNVSRH